MYRRSSLASALALGMVLASSQASALLITGSSGSLSASADFTIASGNLQVVLTNTGSPASVPADVLTGLFFSFSGGAILTPVSAALNAGSSIVNCASPDCIVSTDVGGEWAYATGLSGAPGGTTSGISSAGFGLFGDANFGSTNLQGPADNKPPQSNLAVSGLEFGIVNGESNPNGGLEKDGEISNSVKFLLSINGNFSLNNLSKVWFQYGTALTEPGFRGCCIRPPDHSAPEPGVLALLGSALVAWRISQRFSRLRGRLDRHS